MASGSRTSQRSTATWCARLRRSSCARREASGDVPLMIGHRLMGNSLLCSGRHCGRRERIYDQAIALYDPAAASSAGDAIWPRRCGWQCLSYRSLGSVVAWLSRGRARGHGPALKDAREIGHAATLMYRAEHHALLTHIYCGDYAAANAHVDELVALADEKGACFWKAAGMMNQGWVVGPDR